MKTVIENAEYEILPVIQSIQRDKQSWENWYCLHIETPQLPAHPHRQRIAAAVVALLGSYTQGHEASIYMCAHHEIFVFWKFYSESMLNEVGLQVSNYLSEQANARPRFNVYNLCIDGDKLVQNALSMTFDRPQPEEAAGVSDISVPALPSDAGVLPLQIRGPRVLLVEDDPVTRWMVRMALKSECFLATASTGAQAVDMYKNFNPDMVLLDINLPDRKGDVVLDEMLSVDPGAKVVMFSSQDSMQNISELICRGARGFIAKPFRKEKLLGYIRDFQTA